jgi:steroid 5-alpha reductase family enzyme|tara:strand:+ start:372 stop:1235 length:864 start_codon:yes stop_codon:yes gene_type:complete
MKHIRNLIITAVTLLFVVLIAYLSGLEGNYIFTIPLLVFLVCVIILIQWLMFLPSYLKSTEHYFDITGSITFITVSVLAFILSDNKNIRSILLTLLIIVWATRLGVFLLKRVKAAGSDGRFDDLKDFSTFFMVWNLQALWITFTLLSSLIIFTSNHSGNLEIYDYIGIITWISGLFIEVVADKQKSDFKNDISNKNKFISTGLWKYSRHPNYLGEIILWTGITIIAIPLFSGWSWLGLISPVFVFIMLKFISGVRILENRADMKWGKDKEYLKYKNSTPEIFPFKIG